MATLDDGLSAPLRKALSKCLVSSLSGTLVVTGDPGGVIHLDGGGVVAVQTPGAPSAEVILLRSHRVSEAGWDAAFAASAANGGSMGAELVAGGAVGAGELEALLQTTLADAMFVLASGLVEKCEQRPGPVDCLLPLEPAAAADLLLAEAARRVRVLAALPGGGRERERVVAVPATRRPDRPASPGRDEILALADGRRTPRDIAFASGRGVYATLLKLAELREAGALAAVSSGRAAGDPDAASARGADAADEPAAAVLPQRRKGMPALPRRVSDESAGTGRGTGGTGASRAGPRRLLGPRSAGNASPDDRA